LTLSVAGTCLIKTTIFNEPSSSKLSQLFSPIVKRTMKFLIPPKPVKKFFSKSRAAHRYFTILCRTTPGFNNQGSINWELNGSQGK
jgi:hypothetical protein